MHKDKRARETQGRTGAAGKAAVMGLLERHGPDGHSVVRLKARHRTVRKHHLLPEVHDNVAPGSEVFTDNLRSYNNSRHDYVHNVIDHAAVVRQKARFTPTAWRISGVS